MGNSLPSFLRSIPPATRWILGAIGCGSLFLSLTLLIFPSIGLPSPIILMGVGDWTLREGWFWQLATYWMTSGGPRQFGLDLLIFLAMDLFFVAQVAARVERRLGPRSTAFIWLSGCLVGGLLGATALSQGWFGSDQLLLGNRTGLAGLLMVWMMAAGEEVVWFIVAPVRTKWLALSLLGLDWLQLLSRGNWVMLLACGGAALFCYLASVLVWNLHAPFETLWRMEAPLRWLSRRARRIRGSYQGSVRSAQAVIIDFRTGEEIRRS